MMLDEKRRLIDSMQKLIKHISLSQKNQQQIFQSLSKKDLGKILGNLQDSSIQLRTVSFCLISKLLYRDQNLKSKFCQMMGIPLIPGKLVLNPKILSIVPQQNLSNLLKLVKKPISSSMNQLNSYSTWYINIKQQPYRIDYTDYSIGDIDPNHYIIGIIIKHSSTISSNNSISNYPKSQINSKPLANTITYTQNQSQQTKNKNGWMQSNNGVGRVKIINHSYIDKPNDNKKNANYPVYQFEQKKYQYNKVKVVNKPQSVQIGNYYNPQNIYPQTERIRQINNTSYNKITPTDFKKTQYSFANRSLHEQSIQKKFNSSYGYHFYRK